MDTINAFFEAAGAVFILPSILKAWRERMIRGGHWLTPAFFFSWGIWNIWFYPAAGQPLSGAVAIGCAVANGAWLALVIRYGR